MYIHHHRGIIPPPSHGGGVGTRDTGPYIYNDFLVSSFSFIFPMKWPLHRPDTPCFVSSSHLCQEQSLAAAAGVQVRRA